MVTADGRIVFAAIGQAMRLLGAGWGDCTELRAFLLAISWQEARLFHRVQLEGGPARGLWQFEQGGGVFGVLNHAATKSAAIELLRVRGVASNTFSVWHRLAFDDVLAAGFARLLLWTLPDRLPKESDIEKAWLQYLDAWRPGMPHLKTWPDAWRIGWETAKGMDNERR